MNSLDRDDRVLVNEKPLSLEALLVYEDLETGLRAKHELDQTVKPLEPDAQVQVNLWRIDVLGEPELRDRAAKQAAEADIVFLSMHGQSALPAPVNLWFEEYLAQKGSEPHALAVSLDGQATQTAEALGAAARLAGADVFVHLEEPQEEMESSIESIRYRAETRTRILDGFLNNQAEAHPFREWGINE